MTIRQTMIGIAGLTALCAGSVNAEVTVLGWPGGPEEEALRVVAEIYNARPEVAEEDRVDLLFFGRDGFFDKLQADLAAGSDAFDVNLLATYSIGRYAPYMEPVELSDQAEDVFGETVLSTMRFEDTQYGVPTDLSMHFLFYRQDLIDALLADDTARETYATISEEYLGEAMEPVAPDEMTWRDFAATALYFTAAVNPDSPVRYGTVLQMKNLLFNIMVFQSLPRAYGGDWMDDEGNITVDSDAYREGLELYKLLYDAGATPPDSLSYEFPEANAAFTSGQVAMMVQWSGAAGALLDTDAAPVTAEATRSVAPPAGPEGRFTHIHGLGLGLNANAQNPEGAKAFLEWLSTEEAAVEYARAGGAPGLTGTAIEAVAEERPDLVPLGEYASDYGYVMTGATGANALSVYELQAREFTGYWGGSQDLDATLSATADGMADLLKD
ncbi:multiple sugar transport system substrate-binding protein [Palleronia aestuarii]|uniref:Multiple sugar transport system substrate-binding protein n=1 Tax=Palleronia aestuarii TaxID=568105 RepID=A0A2W7N4D9_9RHOB|nr:extracellular solute-binding protein [Palleronia aestuarii]PZX11714.1 multiple sugar transport system substrate-binding protein [Palleronia aestuarii]